jgi:hypothetical protein
MGFFKDVGKVLKEPVRQVLFDGKGSREWLLERGAQVYKQKILTHIDAAVLLLDSRSDDATTLQANIQDVQMRLLTLRNKIEADQI